MDRISSEYQRISIKNAQYERLAADLAVFAACPVVSITVAIQDRHQLLPSHLICYYTRVSTISHPMLPSEITASKECQ